MMKHRSDFKFRKDICKTHGVDCANKLSEIPLIYLTDEEHLEVFTYTKEVYSKDPELSPESSDGMGRRLDYALDGRHRLLIGELMEGLYYIGDTDPLIANLYYEGNNLCADMFHELEKDDGAEAWTYVITMELKVPTNGLESDLSTLLGLDYMRNGVVDVKMYNLSDADVERRRKLLKNEATKQETDRHFGRILGIIVGLHFYVEEHSIYPVATKRADATKDPKKLKVHAKKPYLRENLVSIKFLNEMPRPNTAYGGGGNGTHRSPVPHRRRAYRRTLRHEKFKNHPLYMVEGGVRVKQSFIGDEHAVVGQVEYRLLKTAPDKKESEAEKVKL